jgi:hypothetical protein
MFLCCNQEYLSICNTCLTNWITLIIAVLGFALTIVQLIKGNKEKSISNVIALKNEMSRYDNIHFKLLPDGEWVNLEETYFLEPGYDLEIFGQLVSYLGLFEVASEMIETGLLTRKQFKTFFQYRFNNIFNNDALAKYISAYPQDWRTLIELNKKTNKL